MTAPAAGGAPTTLQPGAGPVMLTEYAPGDAGVLIINTSLTDRAWLAGDSSASPSNGVPVEPGTAAPWTTPGQLWAVADPAASAPILLIATTAVDLWNPSPAAVAAQVAAELLASGVPSVLVEQTIAAGDTIPIGSKSYDVGSFASLALSLTGVTAGVNLALGLNWYTAGGVLIDTDDLYAFSDGVHAAQLYARLAVEASQLEIVNLTAFLVPPAPTLIKLTMTGSNRPAQRRIDVRTNSTAGARFAYNGAIGAGNTVVMVADSGLESQVSGQATATFKSTGAATGHFDLVTGVDAGGGGLHTQILCDTSEMVTNSNGNKLLIRQVQLPESGFGFQFVAIAAQAGGIVSVDLLV